MFQCYVYNISPYKYVNKFETILDNLISNNDLNTQVKYATHEIFLNHLIHKEFQAQICSFCIIIPFRINS